MKTKELAEEVRNATDFERVFERFRSEFVEADLSAYIEFLMDEHGVSKKDLIIAPISSADTPTNPAGPRALRDRLLAGPRRVEETQRLLQLGGKNELYPRVKRDAAILFCIEKGYSIIDTQIFLSDQDLPLLKE